MVKVLFLFLFVNFLIGQSAGLPKKSESGLEQSAIANNPCSAGYIISTNGDCVKPEIIDTTPKDYNNLFSTEETTKKNESKPSTPPPNNSTNGVSKIGPLLSGLNAFLYFIVFMIMFN